MSERTLVRDRPGYTYVLAYTSFKLRSYIETRPTLACRRFVPLMKNMPTHQAVWVFLLASILVLVSSTTPPSPPITTNVTWQFPNETWIENISVRSNGQILVTLLTTPDLYQVDPFGEAKPKLIQRFPNALGLLGITELEEDVFVVVAGNYSLKTGTNTPGM